MMEISDKNWKGYNLIHGVRQMKERDTLKENNSNRR